MIPATLSVLVPFGAFAMVVAIVIGTRYFRFRLQKEYFETIRMAIEKGQPIPGNLSSASPGGANAPGGDIRQGLVMFAIGAGLYWAQDEGVPLFVSAIVTFIGAALLVNALIAANSGKKTQPANDSTPRS